MGPHMGPQWITGIGALLVFEFLRRVLSPGQTVAKSLLLSQFANNRDGFHAIDILSALTQLMTAALTALGGLLCSVGVAGIPRLTASDLG